ncbi:MAG: hypothetical protein MZV70_28960 [Desulfobacterales bacterium]|nr:hypothetical protein [Desulfobacterales bacterium]
MKSTSEQRTVAVVIATGIASVVTQLVLIREFLSQFQGNEIVIALILFSWLVLGGLGTLLARPAAGSRLATRQALGWLSLALVLLSILTLFGARLLRDLVFTRGASVGFYPTFVYIAAVTAPYALLIGFLLPLSLFVLRSRRPDYPGALVYIWDNIGDIGGGALFSFLIVFWLTPVQAIVAAHLPLLAAAPFLHPPGRRPAAGPACWPPRRCLLTLLAALAAEKATLTPARGELAHYRETRYGRITVVRQQELVTLFQDGVPLLSSQDEAAAEEAVHYALAQLDDAEARPADIGGGRGDGGAGKVPPRVHRLRRARPGSHGGPLRLQPPETHPAAARDPRRRARLSWQGAAPATTPSWSTSTIRRPSRPTASSPTGSFPWRAHGCPSRGCSVSPWEASTATSPNRSAASSPPFTIPPRPIFRMC